MDGKVRSEDNPVLLANRKAKALSSLLKAQAATAKSGCPGSTPSFFLSADDIQCDLTGPARNRVCLKDRPGGERSERKGIIAALHEPGLSGSRSRSTSHHRHQGRQGPVTCDGAGRHSPFATVTTSRRLHPWRSDRRWAGLSGLAGQARSFDNVFCRVRQYTVAHASSEDQRKRLRTGGGP